MLSQFVPKKVRNIIGKIYDIEKNTKLIIDKLSDNSADNYSIQVDYPIEIREREIEKGAGGEKLLAAIARDSELSDSVFADLESYKPALSKIDSYSNDAASPAWVNDMLPGLDAALLYGLVARAKPACYFEIGSGNSTKFVRRAIRDHGLQTRIVSIDPHPRAEIDTLCDEIIRQPLEDVDISSLPELEPGDVVFFDGSHRSFQNSDVTVFFTEILPRLPSGCLYGIHDIYLPYDYPIAWKDRFYNEQYMLMSYLLGGADGDRVLFPAWYMGQANRERVDALFDWDRADKIERHGGSFWMKRGKAA